MDIQHCILYGEVRKIFGYRGELLIRLEPCGSTKALNLKEPVFLEIDGGLVPFFPVSFSLRDSQTALLELEDIENEESARELVGKKIYLPAEGHTEEDPYPADWSALIGFDLIDQKTGPLGKICGLEEYPLHLLFRIEQKGKTLLVPVHEDLIRRIDEKKQQVFMDLPEGITDLSVPDQPD